MAIPVFYINRDCDTARRERIERQLDRAGLDPVRISGVDGRAVPEWLKSYFDDRMTPGEVGCSASHLLAYSAIRERNLGYAAILEDDAEITDDFVETIIEVVNLVPANWDVIRLTRPGKNALQLLGKTETGHSLVRYFKIPVGAAALLVSSSGAKKLLRPRLIKDPIDGEIRYPWRLGLNVYGLAPHIAGGAGVSEVPSTITERSKSRSAGRVSIGLHRFAFNLRTLWLPLLYQLTCGS